MPQALWRQLDPPPASGRESRRVRVVMRCEQWGLVHNRDFNSAAVNIGLAALCALCRTPRPAFLWRPRANGRGDPRRRGHVPGGGLAFACQPNLQVRATSSATRVREPAENKRSRQGFHEYRQPGCNSREVRGANG